MALAPETSQLASTSVVGGVTSPARTDGVPEITVAMAGAASVPSARPRSISVGVVVPPAVAVLVGSTTSAGASIREVDNCVDDSVASDPVGLVLQGEGGAASGHKVVIPRALS